MKHAKALTRALVAVGVALAMAFSAGASPAHAEEPEPDYWEFFDLLVDGYEKGRDGRYDPAEIADMLQKVIAAVNGVRDDVLTTLNGRVDAQIRAQVEAGVTKVPALRIGGAIKAAAVNDIHNAAYLARGQVSVPGYSDVSRDYLARSEIVLFTALIDAYISYGPASAATVAVQRSHYRQGLEAIQRDVTPHCRQSFSGQLGVILAYTCDFGDRSVAATFDIATGTHSVDGGPPVAGQIVASTQQAVQEIVMRDTARPIAAAALEELIRQGVALP
jgi:hypothetical protein